MNMHYNVNDLLELIYDQQSNLETIENNNTRFL